MTSGGGPPADVPTGEHRARPNRVQLWLLRVVVLAALANVLFVVGSEDARAVASWSFIAIAYVLQEVVAHRTRTTVTAEGVRVHNGLTRPRLVRWTDITEVRPPRRAGEPSHLRRRGGRSVELPGVPPDVAQQLAASLEDRRATARDGR